MPSIALLRIIGIFVLAHVAFVGARLTGSLYALANHASTFTVGVILALFSLIPMLIAALMIEAILTPVMMAMIEWSTAAGTIRTLLDDWDVVAFLYWFVLAAVHLAAMWAVRRQVRRMTASDR